MSEILTSREIEDVLSSIRRLVSEDLSPTAGKRISARTRHAAPEDEEEKLLLTPSLRVVANNVESTIRAEGPAARAPEAVSASPVVDPETGLAAHDPEAALQSAPRGPLLQLVDPSLDFPPTIGLVTLPAGDAAGEYLEDEVWAAPGMTEDEEALLLAPEAAVAPVDLMPEVDWFGDALARDGALPQPEGAPALVAGIRSVLADDATAAAMLAASLPDDGALGVLALLPADRADGEFARRAAAAPQPAQSEAAAAIPTPEEETAMNGLSGDPQSSEPPPRVVEMRKSHEATVPAAEIDETYLRELVLGIIREELSGSLGERITRSVRKLVRAELARALTSRDFE